MKPNSYRCVPKRHGRPAVILCVFLLFLALVSFYLSRLFPEAKALGQLFSVVLLLLFVQISTKFLLTEYTYFLEDGTLYLSMKQGKKEKSLGGVPITASSLLYSKGEWEKKKTGITVQNRFSYCQNLFPKNAYVLLCPERETYVLLRFEPDETLLSLLKKEMVKEREAV